MRNAVGVNIGSRARGHQYLAPMDSFTQSQASGTHIPYVIGNAVDAAPVLRSAHLLKPEPESQQVVSDQHDHRLARNGPILAQSIHSLGGLSLH